MYKGGYAISWGLDFQKQCEIVVRPLFPYYRNSSAAMSKVRQHAEDRLRTHLMKRHKIRNRKAALCRFPRRDLYERYGLYKPPMAAGWNSAHASA